MPVEPNITDLFRSAGEPPRSAIDVQAVLRRTRRRRLPRQIGAGSVFSLAVVGVGVAGVTGFNTAGNSANTASDLGISAEESAPDPADGGARTLEGESGTLFSQDDSSTSGLYEGSTTEGIKRAPAERINLCGGTLAEVAPSESGLELTVDFPDATVGATSVAGTVTLTNTGTQQLTGYTGPVPTVTLSQDGIVLWHTNGPTIRSITPVDLAPGESLEYISSFTPVVCGVEDDMAEGFRADLPAAPAGEYQVSAAIDFLSDENADLITGPLETISLR